VVVVVVVVVAAAADFTSKSKFLKSHVEFSTKLQL
jgi:hypothetical protein